MHTDKKHKDTQKKLAEEYLMHILNKVCLSLNIRMEEWNLDKDLFLAIVKNPKLNSDAVRHNLAMYDTCYAMTKKLNIRVNANLKWFTNIN
jgi:hypothetical protein